jgi:uncharacterized protein (TIGR01370 family)
LDSYAGFSSERPSAAADMASLIENVAHNARGRSSNFYVVPVDNDALVDKLDDKQRLDYLKTVDAVLAENVFYHGDKTADNDLNPQPESIAGLDKYAFAHRPVFVVDMVTSADKVADFQERAKARGYLPCASPVSAAAAPPAGGQGAPSTVSPPASVINGAQNSI